MQNIDENIDLDALFDQLSIGGAPSSSRAADATKADIAPHLCGITAEVQELSSLGEDLFLFDTPPDQS